MSAVAYETSGGRRYTAISTPTALRISRSPVIYSASKPDCSNLSVWAFSLTVRTLASSNPLLATAVISRRTSSEASLGPPR